MLNQENLRVEKSKALSNYKQAKFEYLNNPNNFTWVNFCDAKKACMLLGIIL